MMDHRSEQHFRGGGGGDAWLRLDDLNASSNRDNRSQLTTQLGGFDSPQQQQQQQPESSPTIMNQQHYQNQYGGRDNDEPNWMMQEYPTVSGESNHPSHRFDRPRSADPTARRSARFDEHTSLLSQPPPRRASSSAGGGRSRSLSPTQRQQAHERMYHDHWIHQQNLEYKRQFIEQERRQRIEDTTFRCVHILLFVFGTAFFISFIAA